MHLPLMLFGMLLTFGVGGAALWLGDRPARLMGGACIAAFLATLFLQDHRDHYYPQYAVAAVDTVLLVFVIYLAVVYRRDWLTAAGGFMMLVVTTHVAYMIDLRIAANIRATAANVWAYLTLLSLAWGTWKAWQRKTRALN
ncbi:MAG: hypothetical protein JWP35_4361 [Caulobacter sp.]|nr:hypothetical protein [Caulobacter sp.]